MNLENASVKELVNELYKKVNQPGGIAKDLVKAVEQKTIHPYDVIKKMYQQGSRWDEDPRKGHSNKLIDFIWDYVGYNSRGDDFSWCAATVNFCYKVCGYKTSSNTGLARSLTEIGRSIDINYMIEGDTVIYHRVDSDWKGHVAFNENFPFVLGGNQNNKITVKSYKHNKLYVLKAVRRLTETDRVSEPDFKTLKELGLL